MAYLGTTQLSSVSNPPVRIWGGMGAGADVRITGGTTMFVSGAGVGRNFGQQGWMYNSTDVSTAVLSSGYFTDGLALGMRPGDVIIIVGQNSSIPSSQMLRINSIAQVSSNGVVMSSAAGVTGTS